jgi:hypothetical protein
MKWEDEREEAQRKVADLLFNGGTDAEIKAAIERTKLSTETLFPKPDKSKSVTYLPPREPLQAAQPRGGAGRAVLDGVPAPAA